MRKIGAVKIGYYLTFGLGKKCFRKIKIGNERFKEVLTQNKFIGN